VGSQGGAFAQEGAEHMMADEQSETDESGADSEDLAAEIARAAYGLLLVGAVGVAVAIAIFWGVS
jgi:hypothetical protein